MLGRVQLEKLSKFSKELKKFLNSQPSAHDLDASDEWLRGLNAMAARYADMKGLAKGFISQLTYEKISKTPDDEYKKVKNSSTLVANYNGGQFPGATRIVETILAYEKVITMTADNTRTLLSSYRLEREHELKMQVRQTAQN